MTRFITFVLAALLLGVLFGGAGPAQADTRDFIIIDSADGRVIHQEGDVDGRSSPASTFKVPLALMGYDDGVLSSLHEPNWPYEESYNETRAEVKKDMGPQSWLALSAVWYSRKLTRALGEAKFKKYVEAFKYGNMDVSGDPGENNGLTHSWLGSSLKISPAEQAEFLRAMLLKELPVTPQAAARTALAMPVFKGRNSWEFTGKTGTSFQMKDGRIDRSRQIGWFVGWAAKDAQVVIFAFRQNEDKSPAGPAAAGPRAREAFMALWP